MKPEVSMWVLYERPDDAPDSWVLRRWVIEFGQESPREAFAAPDPEPFRQWMIDEGRTCFPRFQEDDPCIVEVWM